MPAPAVSATVTSGFTTPLSVGVPVTAMRGGPPPPQVAMGAYGTFGIPEGVVAVVPEGTAADTAEEGVDLHNLKEWFNAYQDTKTEEMEEQRTARRYYHGIQWTDEERKVLCDRKQPVLDNNVISRKIDGIVGVVIRLRQDPKATPRNERHAAGVQIGNAALREVLDSQAWEMLDTQIAQDLGIDGLGGVELGAEPDEDNAPNLTLDRVAPETFFYDPRSVKPDFSDARFMGVYKWMDLDAAIELMPEKEAELNGAIDKASEVSNGLEDWDKLWYDSRLKRVKIVECWYRLKGEWRGAIHTGDLKLSDRVSPFLDDKKRTICRYRMTSAGVDHNGTRYGFVRNMKSPQDEINHRRSRLLYRMSVNQVIYEDGAVDDIDLARDELAKADGAVRVNSGGRRFEVREQATQIQGDAELLNEAKASIENFGPTPALTGQGASSASGRAQAMQQQAGIAQLGPYFTRYKAWKLDVYRSLWPNIKQFWTTERFIRVSGEEEIQFIPINQIVMTPEGPRIANAIGSLDLDIVMDEGPDVVTLQEDVMTAVTAMINQKLIPQEQALPIVVELSNLPPSQKAKLLGAGQPKPDPQQVEEAQIAKRVLLDEKVAGIRKTNAEADKAQAQAASTGSQQPASPIDVAGAVVDIEHKRARTRRENAEADAQQLGNLGTVVSGVAAIRSVPSAPQAVPFGF